MKVKDLITELQKQDPEKDVMIQQGEDYNYMLVHSVKITGVVDMTKIKDEVNYAVTIEYT